MLEYYLKISIDGFDILSKVLSSYYSMLDKLCSWKSVIK